MAHDDTRGRRGFESRGGHDDCPSTGFPKRDRDTRAGQPGYDANQRPRTPWRGGDAGRDAEQRPQTPWRGDDAPRDAAGPDTRPGRSTRPPFARENREEGWTPFQGRNERDGEPRPGKRSRFPRCPYRRSATLPRRPGRRSTALPREPLRRAAAFPFRSPFVQREQGRHRSSLAEGTP